MTLAASTALAAGGVLLPTSAFAAPPMPHAGTVNTVPAAHDIALPTVEWVNTTDPATGITFKLPGKATVESHPETATNYPSRSYAVDTADGSYGLTVSDLPENTSIDLEAGLQGLIEHTNKEAGATLTSTDIQKTTVDGHPTLDARLVTKDGELAGSIRLIDAGTHVVQLFTLGPAANEAAVSQMHQQILPSIQIP
ncbi:hypothetical protein ACWGI8_27090 [Streptomyces sp. NPDC054841]